MLTKAKFLVGIIFLLLVPMTNAGEIKETLTKVNAGSISADVFIDLFLKTKFYTLVKKGLELSSIKSGNHTSVNYDDEEISSVIIGESKNDLEDIYDTTTMSLIEVTGEKLVQEIEKGVGIELAWLGGSSGFSPEFVMSLKKK